MHSVHTSPERNAGIDLLRVLLSFCVVVIHILHYGGFRTHADFTNSGTYLMSCGPEHKLRAAVFYSAPMYSTPLILVTSKS